MHDCPTALTVTFAQTTWMSHRKRKHRQRSDTYNSQFDPSEDPSLARQDPTLFIVAHEADIIRGPQAARTADSLEVLTNVDGKGGSRIGDGLLKWEGNGEHGDVWVDRYVPLSYRTTNTTRTTYYRSTRMDVWASCPRVPYCASSTPTHDPRRVLHIVPTPLVFFLPLRSRV